MGFGAKPHKKREALKDVKERAAKPQCSFTKTGDFYMLIVLAFDEELKDADLAEISDMDICNLQALQEAFFKWLFDKSIEHGYWVLKEGKKAGCSYDSDAFINWINEMHPGTKEARVVERHVKETGKGMPVLYF